MTFTVTEETFDTLTSYWLDSGNPLEWDCLFVLPGWLEVWWSVFSGGGTPQISAVREKNKLVGIAPLLVEGNEARFIGDPDVCDYQDFIVAPGRGQDFFETLLKHLRQQGITHLDLGPMRQDSKTLTELVAAAKGLEF
ncbi:MAG: hypothetical protein PVI19_04885, partial [Syntrophobacterales bacterium]